MKILILHNDYGRYSGEEAAVDKMNGMLLEQGHEVCLYRRTTRDHRAGLKGKIQVFFSGIYCYSGVTGLRRLLEKEKPDLVNAHNLYPFISPAALFECSKVNIPVIMTVHNYRLICPTGLFMRDGAPCEYCLQQANEWGCIRFNCEDHRMKSIGYSLRGFVARKSGAYQKNVARYACLTDFQKQKLIEAGFEAARIAVIPNGLTIPAVHPAIKGRYIAYVGRLSAEKGWDMLIDVAQRNPGLPFCVAGFMRDGATGPPVLPANIQLKGYLGQDELRWFYLNARFLVLPSRCYEGFPISVIEAMAAGKPVIAPRHGAFPDIIGQGQHAIGCLFRPADSKDLEDNILSLWNNEDLTDSMGRRSFTKFVSTYSSEVIYRQWQELFQDVLRERTRK